MSEPTIVSSPSVLVIDDEDYVADMIASLMRLEGFDAIVAYNGRDGLRLATSFSGQLIIVDIMMPYLNGIELVRQIRELPDQARIPIVLISAGARPRERMPNVTFVAKPFDIEHLLHVVHSLLGTEEP